MRCFSWILAGAALWAQPAPQHGQGGGHGDGHMHRRFDDAAKWAKSFDDPARDQWQMPDRVIAALALKPGAAVADIGAGTGYFTARLARSAAKPRVYASDIEASMVDYLGKRAAKEGLANVTAVRAAEDSPNLPGKVDVALIVDTYHHIPNRTAYFAKLAASLEPGGRVVIIDWRPGGKMGPPEQHRFSAGRIEGEMEKAGYRQSARHDFLPHQNFLVFERK